MQCPFWNCSRPGRSFFDGYCSQSHKKLDKRKPPKVVLFCANCGTSVTRSPSQVSDGGKAYCRRCPKNSGENHPRWREGQTINPHGYRLVLIRGKYKLEHIHTWEQANSACILSYLHGKVAIHHINTVKTDNQPENLVMLSSEVHGRIHRLIDAGRVDEARDLLIEYASCQSFYITHPEYLESFWTHPIFERK